MTSVRDHLRLPIGSVDVPAVLELRERYPRRGPKKLVVLLRNRLGAATPSLATIARVLKRFGMVRRRSRFGRSVSIVERRPEMHAAAPNELWTVDLKGGGGRRTATAASR
jgi:hypothetical protein